MAYILSAAGSSNPVLTVKVAGSSDTGLAVPFLQDVTINNSQDIFTWTQLNVAGKLNVPTTSTNSLDSTVVVDLEAFFGDYTTAATEPTITVGSGPGKLLLAQFTIIPQVARGLLQPWAQRPGLRHQHY